MISVSPVHFRGLLALLSLIGFSSHATAQALIDVGGFESSAGYSIASGGDLAGQVAGASLPNGEWVTVGSGTGTAVVQDSVFAPGGGTQAVQVDANPFSSPLDGDFWAIFLDPADRPTAPTVIIEWDMLVDPVVLAPADPDPTVDDAGPIFGINAFDELGIDVSLLGSLVVDASTSELLFQEAGTGFLAAIDDGTGNNVTVSGWNSYQIELDFSTSEYSYSLNGVVLGTEAFVDPLLSGQFSDADIVALPGGINPGSLAQAGTAYFDNLVIRAIPEPSAIFLLASSFAILGFRRQQ